MSLATHTPRSRAPRPSELCDCISAANSSSYLEVRWLRAGITPILGRKRDLKPGHRTHTLREHPFTSGTFLGPNCLRGTFSVLLYRTLYMLHASPPRPLRSYTAIQRFTALYTMQLYTVIQYTTASNRPSQSRWRTSCAAAAVLLAEWRTRAPA